MSAVITPFKGTERFNTASFNNRISQINTGFSYVSNPNLLDNWRFQIWQRYSNGSYSGVPDGIYVADRWIITSSNGAIKSNLTKATPYGGLKNASGPNCRITQRLENAAQFNGITLTLSVLKNTGFYKATKVANGWNDTFDIFGFFSPEVAWLNAGETIIAAKLELGSTQTLAHQDADGNWVLNEVPDYGEQLRRCQRYYRRWTGADNKPLGVAVRRESKLLELVLSLNTAMRVAPSLTFNGSFVCVPTFIWCSVTSIDIATPDTVSIFLKPNDDVTFELDAYQINIANANEYIALSADL